MIPKWPLHASRSDGRVPVDSYFPDDDSQDICFASVIAILL